MPIFYKDGFYHTGINSAIPADAVEVPHDVYSELFAKQAEGWDIIPDETGFPVVVAPVAVPPTLETVKIAKLAEINRGYSAVMQYIQAGYPEEEVLSWERQASQARELVADPQAEALFVRGLAAGKGLTVAEMCRRILANAAAWEPIAAMLTSQRQVMEETVFAAQEIDFVESFVMGYLV